MSVPASVVNEVKIWLTSLHIKVPLDWIEACIDFVNQEYQISFDTGSIQRLKNCVFEQWLAADLGEIGVQCLSSELSTTQKTTLQGCYTLQVNGIRDVGKSAYSQLKQLDGVVNENAEISATPKAFAPEWEAKPTRMLMLNLTDGSHYIQGMEYKPISFISVNLPVGTKILVQGPIDCRFGVLLLTAEKIKVLGGEVESLIEKYSKHEVLKEALQLRNADVGEGDHQRFTRNRTENHRDHNLRNTPSPYPVNQQVLNVSSHSSDIPLHSTSARHSPQRTEESHNQNTNVFNDVENDFDSFFNDVDEDFIQSINALEQMESRVINSVPPDTYFETSEDEDVYQEVVALEQNSKVQMSKKDVSQFEPPKTSSTVNNAKSRSITIISPPPVKQAKLSTTESPLASAKLSLSPRSSYPVNNTAAAASTSTAFSPINEKASSTSGIISSFNKARTFSPSQSSNSSNQKPTLTSRNFSSVNIEAISSSSHVHPMNQPVSSASNTSSPARQKITQGSPENESYPSISSTLKNLDSSSECNVVIKACFSAALSKLECSASSGWQLMAQLKDSTGTIDVVIHDKVLEEFVGISAKDMVALQMQARTNAQVRDKVMQAISSCKSKMQHLKCLMEIKFSPKLSKPCVIKCFL